MFNLPYLLAQVPAGPSGVNPDDFWTTPVGELTANVLGVAGMLCVLLFLYRAAKNVANGKTPDAIKSFLWGLVIAVFVFQPSLLTSLVRAFSGIVSMVIDTIAGFGT